MARAKRESAALDIAQGRAAKLGSGSRTLDLGRGLTLAAYRGKIETVNAALATYNGLNSEADKALNDLIAGEKELKDWSTRMLAGVGSQYGKDSSEYEKAGGVRQSERKRPKRKPKA
jgi:hypothetical protein